MQNKFILPANQLYELESSETTFSDMQLLEELLQGDLYGNISEAYSLDEMDWSVSNESETEEFLNPPTPPLRFDSLPEDEEAARTKEEESLALKLPTHVKKKEEKAQSPGIKSRTNWFTDDALVPSG